MGGVCCVPPTSPSHKSFQRQRQNHAERISVCIVAFVIFFSNYYCYLFCNTADEEPQRFSGKIRTESFSLNFVECDFARWGLEKNMFVGWKCLMSLQSFHVSAEFTAEELVPEHACRPGLL